jgi:hypothetical protein
MSAVKYVGLDVHAARCAICVMDQQGQVFLRAVVVTPRPCTRFVGLDRRSARGAGRKYPARQLQIFGKATPNAPLANGNFKCTA